MTEQLISFETAKLAEKKKFYPEKDQKTKAYVIRYAEHLLDSYKGKLTDDPLTCDIWAPTQSLLQKWLREEYEIHCEVSTYAFGYYPMLTNTPPPQILPYVDRRWNMQNRENKDYKTYEEALETALYEALKLVSDERPL